MLYLLYTKKWELYPYIGIIVNNLMALTQVVIHMVRREYY